VKDRLLTYLSLIVSIAAFCYAAWVHQHAKQMAIQALRTRETELVRGFAPHMRDVFRDMLGKTNALPADPTTLEELMGAWSTLMTGMVSEPSPPDDKPRVTPR